MSLAEKEFWENYWTSCKLPNVVDENFSFDRCLSRELEKILKNARGDVFEIGCAPGKWLAFLARRIGLRPNGIEYSSKGFEATINNFRLLGLEYGNIINGDFFAIDPHQMYDVVISLGFLEHFYNVSEVIERHLLWLKPDGLLVLGIPNLVGIYQVIQNTLDPSVLGKHNLNIMNLGYFNRISTSLNLRLKCLRYLGSFEPDLPIAPPGKFVSRNVFLAKVFLKIARLTRRIRFIDHINHPYFSSYILAAYENNEVN